jgi:hypothetical protein
MEAKYKVGEKVRFTYPKEGIREGVVFGTYYLQEKLRYSIRSHSFFYTMNEDKIVEKVK